MQLFPVLHTQPVSLLSNLNHSYSRILLERSRILPGFHTKILTRRIYAFVVAEPTVAIFGLRKTGVAQVLALDPIVCLPLGILIRISRVAAVAAAAAAVPVPGGPAHAILVLSVRKVTGVLLSRALQLLPFILFFLQGRRVARFGGTQNASAPNAVILVRNLVPRGLLYAVHKEVA